jgi:two-component sensor histidine kinase
MNTFAILAGLLQRELKAPNPCVRTALERSVRMIRAHSDLHRCLALGAQPRQVATGEYVAELARCLSEALLEPMGITCEAITDEGFMPAGQAERLGLVLCELVVNAAKHGGAHRRTRCVRIEVSRPESEWCCIVADDGWRFADVLLTPGLGTQLVKGLVRRLDGRMAVCSTALGTTVALRFPSVPAMRCPNSDAG